VGSSVTFVVGVTYRVTDNDMTTPANTLSPGRHLLGRPWPWRYSVAIGCVVIGWLAREALTPAVGPTALPFIFFFPAVAVAAWFGGLGPGLIAAGVSAVAAQYFFIEPVHSLSVRGWPDLAAVLAFLVSCAFIIAATEAMHHSRRQLVGEIIERERVTMELAHARDSLATTLASIGDGVIVTDAAGQITLLNREAERLTRWTNRDAAGRRLGDVFHIVNEYTREPVESPAEKVFRTGRAVGLANHTVLIAKDGTETPIDDSAAPIQPREGAPLGLVLVFRDVTEPRKAEATRTRLAAIVEFSGDAIITKNLDGKIESWNAAAERLLGYSGAEIIGQPITCLVPPEHLDEEQQILGRLRAGLASERIETVRLAKDGQRLAVSVSVSPLRDREGRVVGASTIIHDISQRKEAEKAVREAQAELARANADLEKTVQVRTAALQDMVNELEHVSYAITHDMRAPLRAMSAFAQLLLEDATGHRLSAEAQDYCRRIMTGASRLDTLIREALHYTQAALQQLPMRPVDLDQLIRGMLDTYPNFHPDQAEVRIEGRLPIVQGNEALLTQCFSNLLGNAVKFVAPGQKPQVEVGADNSATVARITVRDRGIGIPRHAQSRLFGMFQKLDNQYEGTGIGLAIVRKVVQRMGGKVGVESEVGEGSRFWVELPLAALEVKS
jgi:PAS domain S-box-containing protein